MQDRHREPAASIIAKMGGVPTVAAITGRDPSAVQRWRLPKPVGSDGIIPDPAKILLIDHARKIGVALAWDDFRPPQLRAVETGATAIDTS